MAKPIQSATLTYRQDFNETLSIFRFTLEGGVPDFQPGQFVTLGLPVPEDAGKVAWRAYSIASPPSQKEYLELYIRHALQPVPGKFTSQLWALPVGGTLQHRGITGPFTIEHALPGGASDQRRLLLIAGGTGVAPFIAYALELHRRGTPRELVLFHGASFVDELGYRDVLLDLAARTADAPPGAFRLRYVASVSRPHEEKNRGWSGEAGRIETLLMPREGTGLTRAEEILGEELTPERFFCHVCGYDGTVKGTLSVLEPRGFRSFRKRREDGRFDLKFESYG